MPYIHSFKKKLLVGVGTGLWLTIFLIFVAPFDASDLIFSIRVRIMLVYGLIFFFGYLIISLIEKVLFLRSKKWSYGSEAIIYFLLYVVVFFPTIVYYKSEIVNGDYTVSSFFLEQYIPVLIIITPILYLLRKLAVRGGNEDQITIKGDNKRDILRLSSNELVCVSSSDNYIEVFYLKNGEPGKRLLRTTLKKVESELSFLKRIHRSHLINAEHFVEWQGRDSIVVSGVVLPVSKKYRDNIPS